MVHLFGRLETSSLSLDLWLLFSWQGRRDSDNGEDEDSDFVPEFKNTEWRGNKKKKS
jgi:hypothetical protein